MRWVFRILSVVAVIVVLAFSVSALIPSERIAALAAGEFKRLTGRELVIEGAAAPSLWPVLGVRTGRVTVGNAPWSDAGSMLVADELAIGVDLSELLGGTLRITDLSLTRPVILLERAEDGEPNWSLPANRGEASASRPLVIEGASITDGTLAFTDHATGRTVRLTSVDASARMPDPAGGADLTLSAVIAGEKLDLSATATGPARLLSGEVVPVSLLADVGKAQVQFDGRAGLFPFAAEGMVTADLADLAAISALTGKAPPRLPQGWGAGSVTVAGKLTLTAKGSVHLRDGTVGLDGRRITGDADLLQGPQRPRIVAQVATGDLVFASAAGASGPTGWSAAPFETSSLGLIDADIGFRATALTLGPLRMGAVNGQILIDQSRAQLTLAEVQAYGGAMSGVVVADARKELSVSADLAMKGVTLQPLLTDVAGITRIVSKGDLSLKVKGAGDSVAAIMPTLSGTARLSLGPGRIDGLDLAGLLATLDPARAAAGGETAFDSVTGRFTLNRGDMWTDELALRGQLVRADGQGRIGIAARDLDLRLQTRALTGADGTGGLGVPVLVNGPWSAPRVGLDLQALAAERLDKAARAKAQEKLGLQDGESIEDAAKRKLDEEIQRGIGKALDGLFGN